MLPQNGLCRLWLTFTEYTAPISYLHSHPPGFPEQTTSLVDKQPKIKEIIDTKEKARVIQLLTQINGGQCYKNELQRAREAA